MKVIRFGNYGLMLGRKKDRMEYASRMPIGPARDQRPFRLVVASVVVAVVAAALLLVGCGSASAMPTVPPCHQTLVVGDSLTASFDPAVREHIRERYQSTSVSPVVIEAQPGRMALGTNTVSSEDGVDVLRRVLPNYKNVDCVVFALGTNDLSRIQAGEDPDVRIKRVHDVVGEGVRLIWVNAANEYYPEAQVEWYNNNPQYHTDGVHLTADGMRLRAKLVSNVVKNEGEILRRTRR